MTVLILSIVGAMLAALDLLLWHTVPSFRTHTLLQVATVLYGISLILVALNVSATT